MICPFLSKVTEFRRLESNYGRSCTPGYEIENELFKVECLKEKCMAWSKEKYIPATTFRDSINGNTEITAKTICGYCKLIDKN